MVLTLPPMSSSPGPTSTGSDSPVTSEASTALVPSTTRPSVATFSPGRTTNRSPDGELVDGDAHLGRRPGRGVDPLDGDVLGAERHQPAQGVAGAVGGARLDPAPDEQERRDDGRGLEPDVRVVLTGIRGSIDHPGRATGEHDDGRPQVGREHADRHEGVHRRGAVAGVEGGGPVERPAGPEHDRGGEDELDPRGCRKSRPGTIARTTTGTVSTAATTARRRLSACRPRPRARGVDRHAAWEPARGRRPPGRRGGAAARTTSAP